MHRALFLRFKNIYLSTDEQKCDILVSNKTGSVAGRIFFNSNTWQCICADGAQGFENENDIKFQLIGTNQHRLKYRRINVSAAYAVAAHRSPGFDKK